MAFISKFDYLIMDLNKGKMTLTLFSVVLLSIKLSFSFLDILKALSVSEKKNSNSLSFFHDAIPPLFIGNILYMLFSVAGLTGRDKIIQFVTYLPLLD